MSQAIGHGGLGQTCGLGPVSSSPEARKISKRTGAGYGPSEGQGHQIAVVGHFDFVCILKTLRTTRRNRILNASFGFGRLEYLPARCGSL